MRKLFRVALLFALAVGAVSPALARGSHHSSNGGHYSGGHGSSHKGGHYKNSKTHDHYRPKRNS